MHGLEWIPVWSRRLRIVRVGDRARECDRPEPRFPGGFADSLCLWNNAGNEDPAGSCK
ncbi:hypothetical protein TVNIR_3450 [Thioalkalivibrio nitratireducens DSM 14787]|uniref:Uncharacterized protein n=1 Tax=Thioalkalivibrio nitratireducens (strain DSM 14787 / UNIQEM 213 / ALEN2) TaxID=1255043 RepID=L0E1G5_THIND|nr:hypothetical protein TVNIR_3450 [Thioalkalivibrio nitratireducens DSM 14787]